MGLLAWLSAALPVAPSLAAQVEATPILEGRVVQDSAGVSDATVVLHRVTVDTAGEIDSVRVDPDGRFRFQLPSVPDPGGRGEVYFASVRHQGILYFGGAIHQADQLDSLYTIEVYDTAVVPAGGAALPLEVRYVVAEPSDDGWQITDLFQVRQTGTRTLVPGDELRTVWSYPLPSGIRDVQVGGGDLPPDATSFSDGVVRIAAPVPPGERQFVVRYLVDALDLTFPLPGSTAQMEFLVREPAPPLEVTGLTPVEPLQMDPSTAYRRYTGNGLVDATVVVAPGEPEGGVPARPLAVVLALVLALAGLWAYRRAAGRGAEEAVMAGTPGGPSSSGAPERASRDALILEVARIDEALEGGELTEGEAARLRGRRTSLVRRLQDMV